MDEMREAAQTRFRNFLRTKVGRTTAVALFIAIAWLYLNRPISELDAVCDSMLWMTVAASSQESHEGPDLRATVVGADNLRMRAEWNYYRIGARDGAAGRAVYQLMLASGDLVNAYVSDSVDDLSAALVRFGQAMGRVEHYCRWG